LDPARWIRRTGDLERKDRFTELEDGCRKFHTRASLLSCRARPAPRRRLAGRRGPRHCRCMTTSSLWSRRTRILSKSSGSSLTRRNRKLAAEGAIFERMFAEEHFSQGNYFWLFSGSNQNVGFRDQVPSKANHPDYPFKASSLGEQLIAKGLSFKGYSESLP